MATSFRTSALRGIGVIGMSLCIVCLLGEPADAHGPMGSFGGHGGMNFSHGMGMHANPMAGLSHSFGPHPYPNHPYYPIHPIQPIHPIHPIHPYPPYPPHRHVYPYPVPYPYPVYNPAVYNPVVYNPAVYNTTTDQTTNNTTQAPAQPSAANPTYGYVDPGSLRPVDRWYPDPAGGWIHEYGVYWTSYGVPHKNIHQVHTDRNYGATTVKQQGNTTAPARPATIAEETP